MFKIILAIRYLIKRRITYLAVFAVALCVLIAVVAMTVMMGIVHEFKQKSYSYTGDCVVGTSSLVGFAYYEDFIKALEETDFVEGVSPTIKSYALVSPSWSDQSLGLEIMGIDPVKHSRVTSFGDTLHYRKNDVLSAFEPIFNPALLGCILGIDVGYRLRNPMAPVRNSSGGYFYSNRLDETSISVSCIPLTARGAPAKAGLGLINAQSFYYSDYSHSGLARVDSSVVYLPFEQAQMLCGMDGPSRRANAIHIKFKPNIKLQAGCNKVASLWQKFKKEKADEKYANLLRTVTVQSWKEHQRASIAAMEKEEAIFTIMFALGGIMIIFIVFVVFYMIISHKSKDIGILKSVGVSNANIFKLFSCFAFLVGLLGSGLGLLTSWLFLVKIHDIENWILNHFHWQLYDRTIYAIGETPNQIDPKVLAIIILAAIVACLAGALLPSWRASKLEPIEALQVSQL